MKNATKYARLFWLNRSIHHAKQLLRINKAKTKRRKSEAKTSIMIFGRPKFFHRSLPIVSTFVDEALINVSRVLSTNGCELNEKKTKD